MQPELDDLYRDIILDHYRSPRGSTPLADPDVREEGFNPLCGDEVVVELGLKAGLLEGVSVQCRGCSISTASGSLLAQSLAGRDQEEARSLLAGFKALMHGQPLPEGLDLGDLEVLDGVRQFPVRIKCALLPWTTLEQALEKLPKG